jgi:ubiquinone/menaquinone biosynthesis C-methylase UbiE
VTESRPNQEQSDYWNTVAGPKWLALQVQLDLQLEPYGQAALEAAKVAQGEAVVDIGCGCGATTLELARRVGAAGKVLGLDISQAMIARGRELAAQTKLANVSFACEDAQAVTLPASRFDLLYSRFGVMFFADPVAAFRNLRHALKPGGRLAFVCWQPAAANPWMSLPMLAAMQHIKIDAAADPNAPGPFAFGDAERVRTILAKAGFHEAAAREFRAEMSIAGGATLEDALEFVLQISPLSRPLAEADTRTRDAVVGAIRETLRPYESGGRVRMPSASWIVTARAGAKR